MIKETRINPLTKDIIGASIEVHRGLGPGLLESAYEACLCHELAMRGLSFERQRALPVLYKGLNLDCGYRLDILVEDLAVVEVKAVDAFAPHSLGPATHISQAWEMARRPAFEF